MYDVYYYDEDNYTWYEHFRGSWDEMQSHVAELRAHGFWGIDVVDTLCADCY